MARRSFDPNQAKGDLFTKETPSETPEQGSSTKPLPGKDRLSVSQVSQLIKNTLELRIPSPLRVVGEVSNLSARNHWYFSLKDDQAVVSCVAWASSAKKFGFTPDDGDEVLATGHISHYAPQGRTQLYVSKLEPIGAGALELAFRKMCDELRGLGYFDDAHKIPLPVMPRRIAVITSATGAALQDVIATSAQRCPAVGLLVVDVRVQGEGAAKKIAKAISWVDRHRAKLGVEAMLVTRGGGSLEDLWAFNERVVAEAAYKCKLPLVAAIGHESDTSVIELVADVRAATPTQAMMRLVPDGDELQAQLDHLEHRLDTLLARTIERNRDRLRAIERLEVFRSPLALVEMARERLGRFTRDLGRVLGGRVARDRAALERLAGRWMHLHPRKLVSERHERMAILHDRLRRASHHHLHESRIRIEALDRELAAVDPRNVLKRGYSYTTDRKGKLVRRVTDLETGQGMVTHVADGTIDSVVGGSSIRTRKPVKKSLPEKDQMDLFDSSE
jgi:exodeoxyribonuclease VII large subunit